MDPAALTELYLKVPAFMLVLARIGALFFAGPVLGGPQVPMAVRALLTTAIAVLLTPGVAQGPVALDGIFLLLLIREVLVGAALGFLLDLVFQGVRMGGELINRHAGFSAAENFDPDSDIGNGPMGDLIYTLFVLLFFATGGHLLMLATLARSYEVIPLGQGVLSGDLIQLMTRGVSDGWATAICLSFPVLTMVMMITVVEGVISRAVPQINLLQVTFAVKIVTALAVFYAGMPATVAFLGMILEGLGGVAGAGLVGLRG